ncbi:MAG: UDP-2,4-diacetamido-2,4,6-trideoxy-beta-L-altropyranose hydrolase [Dehalococcoidales bacterium]|nr:UDP-2,4-diacetamido-2,4,6-trideoxy-beta-L-altropyranose hydrolase [Dehalococcoidales bacterium]
MKIAFVVEGGLKMGMGHICRSITLAEELVCGAEICFLTKSDETAVNQIKTAGFKTIKLENDEEVLKLLQEVRPGIVIIDKLDVEEDFARRLKEGLSSKIVIFANMTAANKYADIVVNAVVGSKLKNRKFLDENTNTLYFFGPSYFVLREEFLKFKERGKTSKDKVEKIVLIFGGSDPSNLTTIVSNELLSLSYDFKIDVILGIHFVHFDELNRVLEKYRDKKDNVLIYRNARNVAELMYKADLVIASPGASIFEALCTRTPVIAIPQNLLQKSWFDGLLPALDKNEVNRLSNIIANTNFINPDADYVRELDIGGGKAELIKAIVEGA